MPLSAEDRVALRKTADEFLSTVKEEVDSCVLLEDADRLGRLVSQVDILLSYEVINGLRNKGFGKHITALCDMAGALPEKKAVKVELAEAKKETA